MTSPALRVRELIRRYGSVVALDRLTFEVAAGECVALFGPNGAGKTTLLRILATLARPTSGAVELFGDASLAGRRRARPRIGFLSHQSFLYPDLTPIENLRVYAQLYRIAAPERRVAELLEITGVVGWSHRPLRTLSRGLEQRCAVARALLHDPELLLLDEPFSGLDAAGVAMLAGVIEAARQRGRALLLSTHDLELGLRVSGRALLLRRGRKVWDGAASGSERAAFQAVYDSAFTPAPGARGRTHA